MSTRAIPRVNLQTDSPEDLTDALVGASCAFVTGHSLPAEVRDDLLDVSRAFFDLSGAEKSKVRWPGDGIWRGWQALAGNRVVEDLTASAVLERFELPSRANTPLDRSPGSPGFDHFDLWPGRPEGFAAAWTRYHDSLAALSNRIIHSISAVLKLPTSELGKWCEQHHGNLVVNNYLPQLEEPPEGTLRQRAHTDLGGLTVLWADDAPGGLEVRLPNHDEWTPVEFHDGDLLVQPGDMLARWTNGVLRANIHRVVNPPRGLGALSRRLSVVYFHYPDLDTTIVPADSCISTDCPRLPPMHAGEHLRRAVHDPKRRTYPQL